MQTLTPAEVEHFLTRGHVTIPGCFTRDFAQPLIDHAYERLGYAADPVTVWSWGHPKPLRKTMQGTGSHLQ